jgi:3-dehydroquinate synthase
MKQLQLIINNQSKHYSIVIGQNIFGNIKEVIDLQKYSKVLCLTDENIAPHFLDKLLDNLPNNKSSIILPPGENTKNIETVQKIWTEMKDNKLDRKSLVINLGGGVIGDMGGFAAATYMRGIDFLQIPTTLLSQIDSSVGGKTGIDFAGIKNLVGTFNQPIAVLIDIQTLQTLPERELISGFAEMIKHGLIVDAGYFERVTSKKPDEFSQEELIDLIARSCEIKKEIVETDETEKGQRKLLNFGHTIGHAIESLSLETDTPLLHGEAVSIGMLAEAKISQLQNLISEEDVQKIQHTLTSAGLPISVSDLQTQKVLEKMQSDKKNEQGKINFTLLSGIGNATINQNVPDESIAQAIAFINK